MPDPASLNTASRRQKRVLMIAYEFPPLAAGGINRSLKFARYLPQFGWQPLVLTAKDPDGLGRDATLLDELPDSVRVCRTRSWEYHAPRDWLVGLAAALGAGRERWHRGLTWRLQNLWRRLAIPDHKVYWAAPAVLTGAALVLRHNIDAIYSTSWPYSDHIAAMAISRLTGRPFIADFRDPWTQHMNYRPEPPRWDRIQRRLERAVCGRARFVVTPARRSTQALRRLMADLPPERFVTIRNGFDPADFPGQVEPSPNFEIVHAGTFYKSRQPDTFVEGLGMFLRRVPQARNHTRVRFFGISLDSDLSRFAGIPCFEQSGWTAHKEVVAAFRRASVLFMLRHFEDWAEVTIPGKVYEYLATGNHLLTVQIPQRELDRILRVYGNTTILRRYDREAIAGALEMLYRRWCNGELTARKPPPFVQRFSRVELTRELACLLNRAVGAAPLPAPRRRPRPAACETPQAGLVGPSGPAASAVLQPV